MDGNEQREKGQEGAGGGGGVLDESQGIPELTAYKGPPDAFPGISLQTKAGLFLNWGQVHTMPDTSPPALLHHPRYPRTRGEPERNPKILKESAMGLSACCTA